MGCAGVGGQVLGSSVGTPAATLQRRTTAWAPRSLVPPLLSSDALLILQQMMMPKTSTSAAQGVRTRTSRFGVLGGKKKLLLPFCTAASMALWPGEGFRACIWHDPGGYEIPWAGKDVPRISPKFPGQGSMHGYIQCLANLA